MSPPPWGGAPGSVFGAFPGPLSVSTGVFGQLLRGLGSPLGTDFSRDRLQGSCRQGQAWAARGPVKGTWARCFEETLAFLPFHMYPCTHTPCRSCLLTCTITQTCTHSCTCTRSFTLTCTHTHPHVCTHPFCPTFPCSPQRPCSPQARPLQIGGDGGGRTGLAHSGPPPNPSQGTSRLSALLLHVGQDLPVRHRLCPFLSSLGVLSFLLCLHSSFLHLHCTYGVWDGEIGMGVVCPPWAGIRVTGSSGPYTRRRHCGWVCCGPVAPSEGAGPPPSPDWA